MAPRRFQRRRPTMCTSRGEERVGVAHHRADVEVVLPVLDRDVEVVPAPVEVGHDRLAPPVAVAVDDVAPVAVGEQLRVVARIRRGHGPGQGPTPTSRLIAVALVHGCQATSPAVTAQARSAPSAVGAGQRASARQVVEEPPLGRADAASPPGAAPPSGRRRPARRRAAPTGGTRPSRPGPPARPAPAVARRHAASDRGDAAGAVGELLGRGPRRRRVSGVDRGDHRAHQIAVGGTGRRRSRPGRPGPRRRCGGGLSGLGARSRRSPPSRGRLVSSSHSSARNASPTRWRQRGRAAGRRLAGHRDLPPPA